MIRSTTTVLPSNNQERKDTPIVAGVLDYFPAAIAEVARVSKVSNDQHNPGQPMHWSRGKSADHADCLVRHLVDRGTLDSDGQRHTAKVAWRALALLQEELEDEGAAPGRGSQFPNDTPPWDTSEFYDLSNDRYRPLVDKDFDNMEKVLDETAARNLDSRFSECGNCGAPV
jgi:hypothetical protein